MSAKFWSRAHQQTNRPGRETMKRVLAFPPETKVEWKSHDSSITQRAQIDEQRKEKSSQHHSTGSRGANKEADSAQSTAEKKSST